VRNISAFDSRKPLTRVRAFPNRKGYFLPPIETESRFRPFARRRDMICLPAGVDMRRRNPWVRRRRLL
jgi:hypothetical protein